MIAVLDGWAQEEMKGSMQAGFGGFDLLATTTTQYYLSSNDFHELVLLPAWKDHDLISLWELCGPKVAGSPTFKEQLYYSGESAYFLLQPINDLKNRLDHTIWFVDK